MILIFIPIFLAAAWEEFAADICGTIAPPVISSSAVIDERPKEFQTGSATAKSGFANEDSICEKFLAWKVDQDAQNWLRSMKHDPEDILSIEIQKPHGQKSDVNLSINSKCSGTVRAGISIKLVSSLHGYNQIDKRWLRSYSKLWHIPDDVMESLQLFVGEVAPQSSSRDSRRTFLDELPANSQKSVIDFFMRNREQIATQLFAGQGKDSADWFLLIHKVSARSESDEKRTLVDRWILLPTDQVARFFSEGEVRITRGGSLRIGRITMQRKGGDNGRATAKMLQFKINPLELFQVAEQR